MSNVKTLLHSAVAGVVTLGVLGAFSPSQAGPAEMPKFKFEKCYGIAKAGKNDCQTSNSACAGTNTVDGRKDAWIYVPAGTCGKIVGGSTKPAS